jgi:hypothetical protein
MSPAAIERAGPAADAPAGEPLEVWEVAAVGPEWRPAAGEDDVPVAHGRLELHPDALVFRAEDVVDRATGAPVVEVIAADSVLDAGPLAPGSRLTAKRSAGEWMAAPLRRLRCPGFAVSTPSGGWAFDGPKGVKRAEEIRRRYAGSA